MRINIGSQNKIKVAAVKEVMDIYPGFVKSEINSFKVDTEVDDQPMSLEEIIKGAKNRALNSYTDCDLSIGIESGLMEIPNTEGQYLEICFCSIYNGNNYTLGSSCGFIVPQDILKHVLSDRMNLAESSIAAGYTKDPELGQKQGIIGILTNNKIDRKEYTKQAIIMAMINIVNEI